MDKFELNKIIGAFLLTILLLIVINNLADALVRPEPLARNVYPVAEPEEESATTVAEAATEETAVEPAGSPEPAAAAAEVATDATATANTATAVVTEALDAPDAAPATTSIAALVATASPEAGAKLYRKCASCHTKDKGGKNRVGPNLWNIVGAPVAGRQGFKYSSALAGHGGVWDEEALDRWLENPRGFIPGTKMTFAGIKKEADRAALIAYLKSLSD